MVLKYTNWDADPSLNNADPPVGAPEGATRNKQVNDIIRYVMAAVFEIGDWLNTLDTSLGTMSTQDANAVAIIGGTILNTGIGFPNFIDAGSLTSGIIPDARFPAAVPNSAKIAGLTLQQLYDFMFPVGAVQITLAELGSISVPVGVTAVWSKVNSTRFLKIMADADYTGDPSLLQVGGSITINWQSAGTHNHSGDTGDHILTVSEMPSHSHSYHGQDTSGNPSGYRSEGTIRNDGVDFTTSRGGDAAHSHTISSDGSHTHAGSTIDPLYLGCQAWRRIS